MAERRMVPPPCRRVLKYIAYRMPEREKEDLPQPKKRRVRFYAEEVEKLKMAVSNPSSNQVKTEPQKDD